MKSKHNTKAQFIALAAVFLLLALLIWAATTCDDTLSGNFGQMIGEAVDRGQGGEFDYVGNGATKQYWPNKAKYVNTVPEGQRVFFDSEWLKTTQGKQYSPGPR